MHTKVLLLMGVENEKIKRKHPIVSNFIWTWTTCDKCGDKILFERMWRFVATPAHMSRIRHLCTDCAPSITEAKDYIDYRKKSIMDAAKNAAKNITPPPPPIKGFTSSSGASSTDMC